MKIRDIAHALPKTVVLADEVASWTGADASFIANKIGFKERRFLSADEPPSLLAMAAIEELFLQNPELDRQNVEALIVVTQTPDYSIPHLSAQLQALCSLSNRIAAFDVSLGCSGWVYALSTIRGLMQCEGWSNAVVVTCDPYSKIMSSTDRSTVSVFGDAAAATWISRDAGAGIGLADFGTDGTGADALILKAGRGAEPLSGVYAASHPNRTGANLFMDGRAVLTFMLDRVPISIERCLERNKLDPTDINYFVFHQASKYMIELLRREIGVDEERAPFLLHDIGNCVSSSVPIALQRLQSSVDLTGKRVIVCGFGVGLSWATNVITYD